MNTILTDDEIEALELCCATKADVRDIEAAVLAKLREQEPRVIAVIKHDSLGHPYAAMRTAYDAEGNGLKEGAELTLAAPQPAVVQVPQVTLRPADNREYFTNPNKSTVLEFAAAPEAPAQGLHQQIEQARQNVAQWPQWMKDGTSAAELRLPEQPHCEHLRPMDKVCAPCRRYPNREAQPIPAPWREAVKVARERESFETWVFHTQHRQPTTWDKECAKMGGPVPAHKVGHYYLREDQIRWESWCAALAQLDSLGGGE